MNKKDLRMDFLSRRAAISPDDRKIYDAAIVSNVENIPEFTGAQLVAGYVTDGTEPDVLPLLRKALKRGAKACLPKWNGTEYILSFVKEDDLDRLVPGKWGLLEPVTTECADAEISACRALLLVPGVAFDSKFTRLGRGGGIYDRILHRRGRSVALGVFYECQRSPELPEEVHDEPLDMTVTESVLERRLL